MEGEWLMQQSKGTVHLQVAESNRGDSHKARSNENKETRLLTEWNPAIADHNRVVPLEKQRDCPSHGTLPQRLGSAG